MNNQDLCLIKEIIIYKLNKNHNIFFMDYYATLSNY